MNGNGQKRRFWSLIDMVGGFICGVWLFHSLLAGTPAEAACWLVDVLILLAFIRVLFPPSGLLSKRQMLLYAVAFALATLWLTAGCGAVLALLTVWAFRMDWWLVPIEEMRQVEASYPWLFWPFVGLSSLVGLCFGGAAILGAILAFFKEGDAGSSEASVDRSSKD